MNINKGLGYLAAAAICIAILCFTKDAFACIICAIGIYTVLSFRND